MTEEPTLLLDVMSTLVYDPFAEEMPAFFGMSLMEMLSQKHPTAWVDFEHGRLDEAGFLHSFFEDGRSFDHDAFRECVRCAYAYLPGIEDLLAELNERGVAMHALSNYPSWYLWIEERLGLSKYVQWTFVSCETGVRKPDPEAYLGASRHLEVVPASCLFVDDRESNCEGARGVGMEAIRFEDAATLRRQLAERGIL